MASGGQVQYRTPIRTLRRDRASWTATTTDGDQIQTRSVVANVPAPSLVKLLGEAAPARLAAASARRPGPWGAVVVYAAVDPAALGGELPRYHQVVARFGGALDDGGSCFVSVFGPDTVGVGGAARVTISTHTRVEPWLALGDRREYRERKQRLGERMLTAAERAVPNLRQHLRFFEVATPLSFRRWIDRSDGRVGGVPRTPGLSNLLDLSHRVGLPGLFLCGDSVFPGQGTVGVTLSGINASRAAVEYLGQIATRRTLRIRPASAPGAWPWLARALNGAPRS
jgi:phytoene dehydrogenase-like protein